MDLGIRDRVALVTGGARSLGKADALLLAAEGCRVAIVDLNDEGAEETAKEIVAAGGTARGYACDIRYWRNADGDIYASRHSCRRGTVTIRFYGTA